MLRNTWSSNHQNGVVLVTGASSGIGLSAAIAEKEGYFVIGVYEEKDAVRLQKTYDLQTVILDVTKEVDMNARNRKLTM